MTIFGWVTVFLWILLATAKGTDSLLARLICVFMILGTLVWGTGSLT